MYKNIYLILGLPEGAPWADVSRAYARFMDNLCNSEEAADNAEQDILAEARQHLSEAWEHMKRSDVRNAVYASPENGAGNKSQAEYAIPKLGQLLVASGMLTLDELDAVLSIQDNTRSDYLPLGEILVAAGYLNRQQLNYYLRMQDVLKLPSDHPNRWGQRLIELGWINDDQLKVALLEQQTTGCTLREAFINRGWLTANLLDRIF